jgi:hypothetical protein
MVDSLKALSLNKLHKTLCTFKLDDLNTPDVLNLARYAYKAEGRGSEGGVGRLRDMVCHFLVLNAVTLTADKGFMELMMQGGDFAGDMWRYEIERNH